MIANRGLVGGLRALIGTTDKSKIAIGKLFGRAEALTAVFALTGGQADVFDRKLKAMAESSGALDEAFKEQSEGINKAGFLYEQAKVKLSVMAQTIGETVVPIISNFVK